MHQSQSLAIHKIAFCQRHYTAFHAEQPANIEMLACLRLNRLVRGNHQHHQVDSCRSRKHVADEPFVTGHINETEAHALFLEECKPEIDGDAAPLFFFQAIGMRACKRFNERGLPMVDVPGGSHNDVLGLGRHEEMQCAMSRPIVMLRENRMEGQT